MTRECRREDCTVTETGICLLNNDLDTCPELREDVGDESVVRVSEGSEISVFPNSESYNLTQIRELLSHRYVRLIGILGDPDAGKTACLVSLYLLLMGDKLQGFHFFDSKTLMGFEQISHGARRWNSGVLPEQLTTHTELPDDRMAGFLHLRIADHDTRNTYDLLFPDLPGEWTSQFISENRGDRLIFLKRADAIWVLVNGEDLVEPQARQLAIHRTTLLLRRLVDLVDNLPPIYLVLTRADQCQLSQEVVDELREIDVARDIDLQAISIASFSAVEHIEPGTGIRELIAKTIQFSPTSNPLWSDHDVDPVFLPPHIGLTE